MKSQIIKTQNGFVVYVGSQFSRMDNEPYTYTELEQYSNAGVSEWLNFCWWAKK